MSDSDWKGPLFDPPQVRHEAEQPLRVEQPADLEVRQVVAPPVPGDPQLAAELWAAPAAPPADNVQTVLALGMAVHLLQALHAPDKPGYEHLIREQARPEDDEQDTNQ